MLHEPLIFRAQSLKASLYDDHDGNFFILRSFPLYGRMISLVGALLMMLLRFPCRVLFFYLVFSQILLILNISMANLQLAII